MVERDPRWPADAPTNHLDTVEYWRDLYGDAIKVGQEMLTEARAALDACKRALEQIALSAGNAICDLDNGLAQGNIDCARHHMSEVVALSRTGRDAPDG